jgi:KipI family sensor histidine kinase inhibitor
MILIPRQQKPTQPAARNDPAMTSDPTSLTKPQHLPLGVDGVLIRLGLIPDENVIATVQSLRARVETALDHPADTAPGICEVAASLTSVLVRFDPTVTTRAGVEDWLKPLLTLDKVALPDPLRRWTIPVTLGGEHGPQLAQTAALAGRSPAEAEADILNTELRVLAIGFAPGLPYIGLLPPAWDMPRLSELTPNVPRGALVVALRQLVLFTNPSPTGWRQVGQTAFRGFDPARDPSILLRAGDAIRFARISASELSDLERAGDGLGGARCEVLQ